VPQLIIIAAAGVAAMAGYRFLRREMARVEDALSRVRAQEEPVRVKSATLERGPDGIYRPIQR
jgi:hypothetical protein